MAVVLLSGDLMGASRVEGAARMAGVDYQMVGSVDAAIDCCAAKPVALVMVDLATAGLDVAGLVERLRTRGSNVPAIVAYGPHVHEAVLEAAKQVGCDQVLSRGQFMSQAGAIIDHYAAADSD
jgi:DNA-binding NtrC family response regulator